MSETEQVGTQRSRSLVLRRAFAFVGIAMLLQVSPFLVQVLRITDRPLVRGWRMYRSEGSNICMAQYESREVDGTSTPISLDQVFGRSCVGSQCRVAHYKHARGLVQGMCSSNPGADLRVTLRCGDAWRGWVEENDGSVNLCGGAP